MSIVFIIISIALAFIALTIVTRIVLRLNNRNGEKEERSTSIQCHSYSHRDDHIIPPSAAVQETQHALFREIIEQQTSSYEMPQTAPPVAHTTTEVRLQSTQGQQHQAAEKCR